MKMKKTVSICILCVLALAILIGIFCSIRKEKSYDVPEENNLAQEQVTEEATEEILSSMQVEPVFSYVMVEEAGYLVVYERDMQQIFLETRIGKNLRRKRTFTIFLRIIPVKSGGNRLNVFGLYAKITVVFQALLRR